ncbi:MAG: 23S rRNA (guanosine(2251)-2'-O)-methyltransferase RlmB [Dissulfurispiraceae bacterium]|jgi:23S rRNA (guanosine2251-2'-O)-methyltransferase|nr:23S rRNA (guanosine(2251)-2'-O)-methyltransferase RlmB [Dissulfurispiraceae bacterium]
MARHGRSGFRKGEKSDHQNRASDWIYGLNPVAEALKSGRRIEKVVYCANNEAVARLVKDAVQLGIPAEATGRQFFDERFQKGHQGIAAKAAPINTINIDDLLEIPVSKGEQPFFMVLDCIEDPRNFGAILRTADSAGVHGVVFQSHRSAGITPLVSKTSAGAIEHIALCETVNIKHAITAMKAEGIVIIGAEAGSEKSIWDINLAGPVAIVLGSEGKGLRKTVRDLCDEIVSLPMRGSVNSLNVSVAAGIMAYEAVRRRTIKNL